MPVVRGHRTDLEAFAWLPEAVKEHVLPLVEIVPGRLRNTARGLAASWGDAQPILLDTILLEDDAPDPRRHQLIELFERCRGLIRAIPVGGVDRGIDHTAALAGVAAAQRRGAALRLMREELMPDTQRDRAIDGWLAVVDLAPEQVHLLLDLGDVIGGEATPSPPSAHEILAGLPYLRDWRSVTLAAAAPPKFPPNGCAYEGVVERLDWLLWKEVVDGTLTRAPGFGDHIVRPPGTRDGSGGASIAYKTPHGWLVVKRSGDEDVPDTLQAASQALLARPEFAGGGHCQGCALIEEYAAGRVPAGLEDWRAAGVCHHIETSVAELAALVSEGGARL